MVLKFDLEYAALDAEVTDELERTRNETVLA
jgi:hypothetical protein